MEKTLADKKLLFSYLRWYVDEAKAKGAIPILSGQTPNNPYENVSTIVYGPPRVGYASFTLFPCRSSTFPQFVPYAKNVAAAKGVAFVDHYLVRRFTFKKCLLLIRRLCL